MKGMGTGSPFADNRRGWNGRTALWCAVLLLAPLVLWLAVRNGLAISAQVPRDPNEGWNAVHALRLMAGGPLYPSPHALMVNNYPPLSFYAVAALTRLTGDAIIAGRLLSFVSYLAGLGAVAALAARMGCGWPARLFAALFLAAVLLVASDYVAMDDPQLLGHALQLGGLLLLLRRRRFAAALAMVLGLYVKHNLIALPLAAGLWLLGQDRREGLTFIAAMLASGLAGLALFRWQFGTSLLAQLATPRLSSLANMRAALGALAAWAALPLLLVTGLFRPARTRFDNLVLLYLAIALALGLAFSAGDGVDANIFFDAAIALALGLGLVVQRRGRAALPPALALLLLFGLTVEDNAFAFGPSLAGQSARDIAFLRAHSGPAVCQQISLCLWTGATPEVDVFNIGEAYRTGARDPAPLVKQIEAQRFAVLQLGSLDDLGPQVRAAITRAYRLDHADDNGLFWLPRNKG